MKHFGEDHDREIAAECLISQCPKEAALAEAVLERKPGAKCPHTHFFVGMAKTTTLAPVQPTLPPVPLPPELLPAAVLHTVIAPVADASTVAPGSQDRRRAPAVTSGLASPCATVAPSSNLRPYATVAPFTSNTGRSHLVTGNVSAAGATVQPVDADAVGHPSLSMLILITVAGVAATLAALAKVCQPRSSSAVREVLLPRATAEGDHMEELEAMQETTTIAIDDAE